MFENISGGLSGYAAHLRPHLLQLGMLASFQAGEKAFTCSLSLKDLRRGVMAGLTSGRRTNPSRSVFE